MLSTTTPTPETITRAAIAPIGPPSPSWTDQAKVVTNPTRIPPGHKGRGAKHPTAPVDVPPPSPPISDNRADVPANTNGHTPGDSPAAGHKVDEPQARSARVLDDQTEEGAGLSRRDTPFVTAAPSSPWDAIVTLTADILDDIERARISAENQLRSALDIKGLDPVLNAQHLAPLEELITGLQGVEAQAIKRLASAMKHHPLGAWVADTPGLGAKTVGRFLGAVGPIHQRTMPSQLWAYCGLHVVDGHAPRRTRGEKANWSTRAKTRAYLMAEACVKLMGGGAKRRSPFRDVYDASRALDELRQSDRAIPLTDGHAHARAMRKVSKAILQAMWVEARRVAGLPTESEG